MSKTIKASSQQVASLINDALQTITAHPKRRHPFHKQFAGVTPDVFERRDGTIICRWSDHYYIEFRKPILANSKITVQEGSFRKSKTIESYGEDFGAGKRRTKTVQFVINTYKESIKEWKTFIRAHFERNATIGAKGIGVEGKNTLTIERTDSGSDVEINSQQVTIKSEYKIKKNEYGRYSYLLDEGTYTERGIEDGLLNGEVFISIHNYLDFKTDSLPELFEILNGDYLEKHWLYQHFLKNPFKIDNNNVNKLRECSRTYQVNLDQTRNGRESVTGHIEGDDND